MAIQMTKILKCTVTECVYNRNEQCHTAAITVGDGAHAACDTFYTGATKGGIDSVGGVGACKAHTCKHNKGFECYAPGINVNHHSGHADCTTFSAR